MSFEIELSKVINEKDLELLVILKEKNEKNSERLELIDAVLDIILECEK